MNPVRDEGVPKSPTGGNIKRSIITNKP